MQTNISLSKHTSEKYFSKNLKRNYNHRLLGKLVPLDEFDAIFEWDFLNQYNTFFESLLAHYHWFLKFSQIDRATHSRFRAIRSNFNRDYGQSSHCWMSICIHKAQVRTRYWFQLLLLLIKCVLIVALCQHKFSSIISLIFEIVRVCLHILYYIQILISFLLDRNSVFVLVFCVHLKIIIWICQF